MAILHHWPEVPSCPICSKALWNGEPMLLIPVADMPVTFTGPGTMAVPDMETTLFLTIHAGCRDAALTIDYQRLVDALAAARRELAEKDF